MGLIRYETRLSYRRNLDKSDVEGNYGSLVSAIGGNYFVNGVSQGVSSGVLDWRNFSIQAGIPNGMRANPNAIYGITVDFGATVTTNSTYLCVAPIPPENVGIVPTVDSASVTLIGWTVVLRDPSNATNGGNATLFVRRRGVDTNISGPTTWTNVPASRATSVINVTGLTTPIQSRDVIFVKLVTTAAGVGYGHAIATVWLKGRHVRG